MPGSNQFTPGPINIFARLRTSPGVFNSTAYYLGTCIQAPEPESEYYNLPVMNDLGGRSVPFQIVQDGEKDLVVVVMNRFDITVARMIRALRSGSPTPTTPPGGETGFARGTLMLGISDFQLILINTYALAAAGQGATAGTFVSGTSNDLNIGRIYFSANCLKYKESTIGTRTLEIAMALECNNLFNTSTRGFVLYSENPSDFGSLAPVT